MDKLLVVLGPTATGKTDLGIFLADKFNGEIVACDSRQVYKGLDIGTGKMPSEEVGRSSIIKGERFWEVKGVKIWMYDVSDPKVQFSVKNYVDLAQKIIKDIIKRGKLPILVGGTGLYIKGVLEGFEGLEVGIDENLRSELDELSVEELQKKLEELSSTLFQSLSESDRVNKRRLIRKIEFINMYPYIESKAVNQKSITSNFDVLKIGLVAPRSFINQKIDSRLNFRFNQGLLAEAKKLSKEGVSWERMRELGLEYAVLADFLESSDNNNQPSEGKLLERLKIKNHQYAKRQITWFKRENDIKWFDVSGKKFREKVERLVADWYNS